ncbi:MAG: hypothetical protein ABJO67_12305 [Pseudoruegeria sp.]
MASDKKSEIAKSESDVEDATIIEDAPEQDAERPSDVESTEDEASLADGNDDVTEDEDLEPEDPNDVDGDDLEDIDLSDHAEELSEDTSSEEEITSEDVDVQVAETVKPEPAVVVEKTKKVGFFPVVLGGVIAAGLGYGVSTYLIPQQNTELQEQLQAALAAQSETIEGLKAELTQLNEANAEPVVPDTSELVEALQSEFGAQIAAISDQVGSVSQGLEAMDTRITDAEKRPISEFEGAAAAVAAYEGELQALQKALERQQTTMDGLAQQALADVEKASKAAAAKEAEAKLIADTAITRAALVALTAAMTDGATFEAPIAELQKSAGSPVPEALLSAAASGITPLSKLQEDYPSQARAVLAVTIKAENADTVTDRVFSFLRNQTGARSLTPKAGADPDAILSRVEAAVQSGDLETALTELAGLPQEGQDVMADWISAAKTRATTVEAARAFAQSLDAN